MLANETELHLEALNATALSVQANLARMGERASDDSIVNWTLLVLRQLNPMLWRYVANQPFFQAFWVLLKVISHLGWLVLSTGAVIVHWHHDGPGQRLIIP
ncbi:hypothetical protein CALCODRAFT_187771 [Calocera cornea HHB12733]|uniref:Uncharacterized protein n=1 Tax=Calocera cornea HHB12733 TaxID=1353952 RepID=A0A165HQ67_9BASI|nr:hypothetical protein CALCODRAFT_187771 [Calocera cornea HHB12733]